MSTHLQKITARAKQLKKQHPNTKWTNLVKKAAKELKAGIKTASTHKVSGTKNKHKKQQTMATNRRTVVVAGHKKHHTPKRKVGATSGGGKMKLTNALWMLAGGVMGGSLGAVIYRRVPGNDLIKGGVQAGLGLAGMTMVSPGKHPLLFGLANGVGVAGGVNVMHGTGVIAGVEDMVSGLFDGMTDNTYNVEKIPNSTAGTYSNQESAGLHEGGYMAGGNMGYTKSEIDQWVTEGIPGMGAEDWR